MTQPTPETVERVARAIDACCGDGVSRDWVWWEKEARAALAAIGKATSATRNSKTTEVER